MPSTPFDDEEKEAKYQSFRKTALDSRAEKLERDVFWARLQQDHPELFLTSEGTPPRPLNADGISRQ